MKKGRIKKKKSGRRQIIDGNKGSIERKTEIRRKNIERQKLEK